MGRPLYFTPVIYYFFLRSNLPGRRTPPRGSFARMLECDVILLCRSESPHLYPLHFEGRKSANFASQLGNGATLNSCNLKTRLQIEKLIQMHFTASLSSHNCQASVAVFFVPKLDQNYHAHLYSAGRQSRGTSVPL